jgi:hypothetical protein
MSSSGVLDQKKTSNRQTGHKQTKTSIIKEENELLDESVLLTPPSSFITSKVQPGSSSPTCSSYLKSESEESQSDLLNTKCLKFSSELDKISSELTV